MQSILNDLFIARNEGALSKRLQKVHVEKASETVAENLQKSLNEEQLKLFFAYEEDVGREKAEIERTAYRSGLRDGATLMMEICCPQDEPLLK